MCPPMLLLTLCKLFPQRYSHQLFVKIALDKPVTELFDISKQDSYFKSFKKYSD